MTFDFMHGSDYAGQDPTGWIVTEKFDGFFARWTGSLLLTRSGHDYNAPKWITEGLPAFALDCELFAGYGQRETMNNLHRSTVASRWDGLRLIAFDAPNLPGTYIERKTELCIKTLNSRSITHPQMWRCSGPDELRLALKNVTDRGGEGLMIRHPSAPYQIGVVQTMLKVKPEFV